MISGRDLEDMILFRPFKQLGCDELRILTGYATASMASRYIELLGKGAEHVTIRLIVGMTPSDGIINIQHENFKKLMEERKERFECSYIMLTHAPCHAKLYVWLKNGTPIKAFIGSANYTQNAFYGFQEEIMDECDPQDALDYYDLFADRTIFCNHNEVEDAVNIISKQQYRDSKTDELSEDIPLENRGFVSKTLSLLTSKGKMGGRSGLNWGQREDRDRNQAYIPMQRRVALSGFFPKKELHFTVITDDAFSMICSVAQGDEHGKAIHTPLDNAELGRYFRKRIGTSLGARVEKEDLERYGRSDVTFYKIDDETYYMDFSVQKSKGAKSSSAPLRR